MRESVATGSGPATLAQPLLARALRRSQNTRKPTNFFIDINLLWFSLVRLAMTSVAIVGAWHDRKRLLRQSITMPRSSLLALTLCIFVAMPAHAAKPRRIPGLQRFEGPLLDIVSPAGKGWVMVDAGTRGKLFMRDGKERHASLIATVTTFPVEAEASVATFDAQVRENVAKEAQGARYQPLSGGDLVPEQHGAAHCLRYSQAVTDLSAQVGRGDTATLVLELHALYCRHPADPALGVAITYSVRAPQRTAEETALAAQSFFDGVVLKPAADTSSSTGDN